MRGRPERNPCNHCYPTIQCETCGKESLAPKTVAEERLIKAAIKWDAHPVIQDAEPVYPVERELMNASRAVLKERKK